MQVSNLDEEVTKDDIEVWATLLNHSQLLPGVCCRLAKIALRHAKW